MHNALSILGGLNENDLEWLIATGHREMIPAGTVLIREGQPVEAVYIVLDGAFGVLVGAGAGHEVARRLAGEILGEISFVDSRPPTATVQAVEASRVLAIPQRQLAAKLEQDMPFAARFYQALGMFLAYRLRTITSQLGYGTNTPLDTDVQDETALAPQVLENPSLSEDHFDRLLQRLRGE